MSSGSNTTSTSCTLTIGGTSGTFTVTTKAAGNFTVSAAYGVTIVGLTNSTSVHVPASLATINVLPGQNLSVDYSANAIVGGQMIIQVSGIPAIPGHIRANCYVNGVSVDTALMSGNGGYGLNIISATDPTPILVAIESF